MPEMNHHPRRPAEHHQFRAPDTAEERHPLTRFSAWLLGLVICALAVAFFVFPQTEPDRRRPFAPALSSQDGIGGAMENFLEQEMENPAGAGLEGRKP